MNGVYPRFKSLLKDPANFSSRKLPSFLVRLLHPLFCKQPTRTQSYKKSHQSEGSVEDSAKKLNRNKQISQRILATGLLDKEIRLRDVVTRQASFTIIPQLRREDDASMRYSTHVAMSKTCKSLQQNGRIPVVFPDCQYQI
ncbi:hypothetical protein GHT06_020558 [Daphnia sinensis]|uniref:Uncharacterized protein n=1 Tax=Daphnia sinensis TaxID=1820382 RepID=A0AAD5KHW5_9CRUS|nr:hypothetical protein GHT06_020558 [Daphnia sinensis]